jgi:hypothetical protein
VTERLAQRWFRDNQLVATPGWVGRVYGYVTCPDWDEIFDVVMVWLLPRASTGEQVICPPKTVACRTVECRPLGMQISVSAEGRYNPGEG